MDINILMSALPLFILTKSEEGPDFCICIISATWFFLGRCEHLFPQVGCQWMMDQWNHSTQVPPSVAAICWGHLQSTGKECIHALSMDDSKAAASLKIPWQHLQQVTKAATPQLPDNLLATPSDSLFHGHCYCYGTLQRSLVNPMSFKNFLTLVTFLLLEA